MRFTKDMPDTMLFKNDIRDEFQSVKIVKDDKLEETIPTKYKQKLPVSASKKKDLIALCKNGSIPKDFHEYYKNLPSSASVQDKLPEPDAQESDGDESE